MSAHKTLSPSSAERRRLCRGSLAACKGMPNPNTIYAAEGTAYHLVASTTLEALALLGDKPIPNVGYDCADYVGRWVNVFPGDRMPEWGTGRDPAADFSFKIDEENAAHAQTYVDAMLRRKTYGPNVDQMYEVKLDTSELIGVPGQGGTGDCITLDFANLTIYADDLKFGRGKQVFASYEKPDGTRAPNDQAAWYAAAALRMFRCMAPWRVVVLGIHQPRIHHTDEFYMGVDTLDAWVAENAPKEREAHRLWESGTEAEIAAALTPSKEACYFCPLDQQCSAQIKDALEAYPVIQLPDGLNQAKREMWVATDEEFLKVLELADRYEDFWSAVKGEGLRRAQAGATLPGWEVVVGNKGRRALNADAEIEFLGKKAPVRELLTEHLGDAAFEPAELKTAAVLDKELSKVRGIPKPVVEVRKELWQALQPAITQADGKPQLARVGSGKAQYVGRSEMSEFAPITLPNQ